MVLKRTLRAVAMASASLFLLASSCFSADRLIISTVNPEEVPTIGTVNESLSIDDLATAAALRASAEKGGNDAPCDLASLYATGHGIDQDYIESYKWFTICATKPLSDGPMEKILAERRTVEKNMKPWQVNEAKRRTLFQLRQRAWSGDYFSQISLGRIYANGLSAETNYEEAYYWYRLAVNPEHNLVVAKGFLRQAAEHLSPAQIEAVEKRVGEFKPRQPPANTPEIPKELLQKARTGDAEALYQIGNSFKSIGDDRMATHWYIKAATRDDAKAAWMLAVIYGTQMNQAYDAESYKWARMAALQGVADAQAQLGFDFGHAKGVQQDDEESYFWWKLASLRADPENKATKITAENVLSELEKKLTDEQKARVTKRVQEWRPVRTTTP